MAIYDEDLKKQRALKMIDLKVSHGMDNAEIAKQMGVCDKTVIRSLAYAKKAGLFLQFENTLLNSIVPASMTAIKQALDDGDAETGLKILFGLGILKTDKQQANSKQSEQDADELNKYIEEARIVQTLEENTVDGTLITGTEGGLARLLGPKSSDEQATKEADVAPDYQDSSEPINGSS